MSPTSLTESPVSNISSDLEGAAECSRLSSKLTDRENHVFSKHLTDVNLKVLYITIRNYILKMFLDNPSAELTFAAVFKVLQDRQIINVESHYPLCRLIFAFLCREGYINFGVYAREKTEEKPIERKQSIIVIGAGMAGLTCARQLQNAGFNVTIYESRAQPGGRMCTFVQNDHVADEGAMVVTGLIGNPLTVLIKQSSLRLQQIQNKCPLYRINGQQIPSEKDDLIEKQFNELLEAASVIANKYRTKHRNGEMVSLGQMLELLIIRKELLTKMELVDTLKGQVSLHERHNELRIKMGSLESKINAACKVYLIADKATGVTSTFMRRSAVYDYSVAQTEYELCIKEHRVIEKRLKALESKPHTDVFLSKHDRQILDWHFANLEFANAAPLDSLSLKHWDQDDDYEFGGNHYSILSGFSSLAEFCSQDLKIHYSSSVTKISYVSKGVEVTYKNGDQMNIASADMVVITVPLGVLKQKIIKFDPPLPHIKVDAIERMGFGNLNKVILCFEKPFWDSSVNMFGSVPLSSATRGEDFLFWSLYEQPTLIALLAGEAASIMETMPDEVVILRCLDTLRSIYGSSHVPDPLYVKVTHWGSNPCSFGSYSYVASNCTGADYDSLALPVCGSGTLKRLFFAGEHTNRNYPATVHGAFLSGLREATRIMDHYIGELDINDYYI